MPVIGNGLPADTQSPFAVLPANDHTCFDGAGHHQHAFCHGGNFPSPFDLIIETTQAGVHAFEELDDWEGLNFDLIITLSPEAHHKALELTRTHAVEVEYWPTQDPTTTEGNREQRMQAYREVCDGLSLRIRKRFARGGGVGL